jgi:Zn-dependent metalloprotease
MAGRLHLGLILTLLLTVGAPTWAIRDDDAPASGHQKMEQKSRTLEFHPVPADRQAAAKLAEKSGIVTRWNPRWGTPQSVRGPSLGQHRDYSGGKGLGPLPGAHAHNAIVVMDNLSRLYGLQDAEQELKVKRVDQDQLGFNHVRLTQYAGDLRVVGGELIVHFGRDGEAYAVNGSYIPDIRVERSGGIPSDTAVGLATKDLAALGKPAGSLEGAAELVVFALASDPRLAYELILITEDPKTAPGRWRYWIDAKTGEVLLRYNDIKKIAAPTSNGAQTNITGNILSGEGGQSRTVTGWRENTGFYYLYNTNRHWLIYDIATSGSYSDLNTYAYRSSTNWAATDRAEMSAAINFDIVQRYYALVHGRNSFDNAGFQLRANVHQGVNYVNAYWDSGSRAIYIGDGDGTTASPLGVLDICGHEYTHAVTENTAGLNYVSESGALNESFSDIFGVAIEFYAQPDGRGLYPGKSAGTADWLIGEDSWLSSTALRDVRNPRNTATVGSGNEQPSRYKGTYWFTGSSDNGGVHHNSGVQNFFFYLLSEGGTGNNDGINYSLAGIGITNAARVAYRALTVYCTSSTDYPAVRDAWVSAAVDLNASWVPVVIAAWSAVGIDNLVVNPDSDLVFNGRSGGGFTPASQTFNLRSRNSTSLNWSLAQSQPWATLSPSSGTIPVGGSNGVTISINSAANGLPMGIYTNTITFSNTTDGTTLGRQILLAVAQPNYYVELFDAGDNDLAYQSWTFTPTGSSDSYAVCRQSATNFPTNPAGGTTVLLGDDSYAQVTLSGTNTVAIYSLRTNVFYIGSNGYLTMMAGDTTYTESYAAHFSLPRVSALFDDFYPPGSGTISWRELSDRVAVTYTNILEYNSTATVNFQIEMFFDGRIRLTYLAIGITDGLVGLSPGQGIPLGFTETNFTSIAICGHNPPSILSQPVSQSVIVGAPASFSLTAAGDASLGYQWRRDGTNMGDGGNIFGTTTTTLVVSNTQLSDNGAQFSCLVTNLYGAVPSSNAVLIVLSLPALGAALTPDGAEIQLTWPEGYLGWVLQVQTNEDGAGLGTNWFALPGSTTSTNVILPIDPALPGVFYRLLSPVIQTGNPSAVPKLRKAP